MKYGIVISVSKTKFGPIVFKESLEENIRKVIDLGYDGVELAIKKPESLNIGTVDRLIEKNKISVIAIGTGQIYFDEGLSFSDSSNNIRKQAVKRVKQIIDIASHFNSSIIIGLIRGKINSLDNFNRKLKKAENRISECMYECLDYSRDNNINFLLEPINRYETDIFNKLEDIIKFINNFKNSLDISRIGVLADTFHMNIEEPSIEGSFQKYFQYIKHVHFADSNRYPPGHGHINFKEIMHILKANEYNGFISFEMLPYLDSEESAREALNFVKKIDSDYKGGIDSHS